MVWREARGPVRTLLLQSQRSPNCLSKSAHIACKSSVRGLIALTFRNLTCKKMAIRGKPGGVGWDGTHKADHSSDLRGGTLPSQASYGQPTAAAQLPSLTPLGCAVGTASTLLP